MFATKIEPKDINLERKIRNFLILNIQGYSPLKTNDDHEEFIGINEIDKIVINLDIKKAPGIDRINNKLIKHFKPSLIKFLHFFFNLCINFGKPEDLVGSYRPFYIVPR